MENTPTTSSVSLTISTCAVQGHQGHSRYCAALTTVSRTFSSPQTGSLQPPEAHCPTPSAHVLLPARRAEDSRDPVCAGPPASVLLGLALLPRQYALKAVRVQLVRNPLPLQANILLCGRTTLVLPSCGCWGMCCCLHGCANMNQFPGMHASSPGLCADCSPQPTPRPQRGMAGAAAISGGVQGTEGQALWCVFGKAAPGKGWWLLGSPGAWALPSVL